MQDIRRLFRYGFKTIGRLEDEGIREIEQEKENCTEPIFRIESNALKNLFSRENTLIISTATIEPMVKERILIRSNGDEVSFLHESFRKGIERVLTYINAWGVAENTAGQHGVYTV